MPMCRRASRFVRQEVLREAVEAPDPNPQGEPGTEEELDYAASFRGRSFRLACAVKPADCLFGVGIGRLCGRRPTEVVWL